MRKYLYELHAHTKEGSACSELPVREMVAFYKKKGYAGLCLTDHFSGNSTLDDSVSWETRVNCFFDIYEEACDEAKKLGDIDVFFGVEYSLLRISPAQMSRITGNDFLIYGLDRSWWLDHPHLLDGRATDALAQVREAGGFVVHAHPFCEAQWIEYIRLLPRSVDAVEVVNACLDDRCNDRAKAYAESYDLLQVAGSDTHSASIPLLAGVETDAPCHTIQELIAAIREKRAVPFRFANRPE